MDKVGINAPSGNVIHFKSVERAAELFGERGWDVTIGEDVSPASAVSAVPATPLV